MTSKLFKEIERLGLISKNEVNKQKIEKLSASRIIDFSEKTKEIITSKEMAREKSIFSFSASLSMGGGNYPCENLNCRFENVKKTAQFAALYSDRVYINYYANDYNHFEATKEPVVIDAMKSRMFNDLKLLCYLRPLIEGGKIILFRLR